MRKALPCAQASLCSTNRLLWMLCQQCNVQEHLTCRHHTSSSLSSFPLPSWLLVPKPHSHALPLMSNAPLTASPAQAALMPLSDITLRPSKMATILKDTVPESNVFR